MASGTFEALTNGGLGLASGLAINPVDEYPMMQLNNRAKDPDAAVEVKEWLPNVGLMRWKEAFKKPYE